MKTAVRELRNRYYLFVGITIVVAMLTQFLIYRYLDAQYEDASLINIAGRQRMLSQRVTKIALYIQRNNLTGEGQPSRADSLKACVATLKRSNDFLLMGRKNNSAVTDSLLRVQGNLLEQTSAACDLLIAATDAAAIRQAVRVIEANDLPFLLNMEHIVSQYQKKAEAKIRNAERMEFVLAFLSVIVISAGFIFIVQPSVTRMRVLNHELSQLNFELTAQDEEIRSGFEKITELQGVVEKREREYRERVEASADIIYEMDQRGYYTYINPMMITFTGYSHDELLSMHYYDLIAPKWRDAVIAFYQQQVKEGRETSYHEFPILTQDDRIVWVSQTIRIIFSDHGIEKIHANVRDITELQVFRESLERSEKRFKSFADNSPVGIYEFNSEGSMVYVNRKYVEISGIPEHTAAEERMKAIHPEDRERTMKAWREAQLLKSPFSFEFRFVHPDRGVVWVVSHAAPLFDEHWKFQGYIGTMSDITERRKAYAQLAESERTYKLISSNSRDLIMLFKNDAAYTRTFVSPSVRNILGYEPEELVGKTSFDIVHPEDASRILPHGSPSDSVTEEFRMRRKDGSYVWMESTSHPYYDDRGDMIGIQSSARDITSRKEMEKVLAEREELYRLLSENSRDMIALHEPDGTYRFISSSFFAILGYTPADLVGKSPLSITHPDDVKWILQRAEDEPMTKSSLINFEYRMCGKDQRWHWIETYLQPIVNNRGDVTSIQSSSREVTERKQAEAALTEARTKAEAASDAKSQFLSMMSHEIRTPMNAVIGLTNFMIEDNPAEHQKENLRLLKYSGDNLLAIINDILDFSKIEAGKTELDEISFDLPELLRNVIKMMQRRATEKGISIGLRSANNLPVYVVGDPVRINQIMINLMSNAIKFTEEGQVTLEAEFADVRRDVFTLVFSVTDTGIGIERDKTELIFERFSQAARDTTRKFGGTGLGLAISRSLVALMGSELKVESELGKGSRFYFSLNLKAGTSPEKNKPDVKSSGLQPENKFHVLLVEDNPVNQVVASNYLKKWGLEVTVACNGEEAVEKVRLKIFQLVLMDMQMPVMDGYTATRQIRELDDSYFKSLPIIALTASVMADRETILENSGLTDFIGKPFSPEELHTKVFQYLHRFAENGTDEPPIKIDQFALGSAEEESKLASFMAENLTELCNAFQDMLISEDTEAFRRASHKSKTTLAIIADKNFTKLMDDVDTILRTNSSPWQHLEKKKERVLRDVAKKVAALDRLIRA